MKKMITLFLSLVLMASFSHAGDSRAEGQMLFWEALGKKIEGITPKKKPAAASAVWGVRGVKNRAVEDLYWKGEEVRVEISEEELDQFSSALRLVEEGRMQQAGEVFEQFIEEYPDSRLIEDARQAVEVIQTEAGEVGGGI